MVFCYKVITECRRSGSRSPRKKSPPPPPVSSCNVPSSESQLLRSVDYDTCSANVFDDIPAREWRLLAALARKREQDDAREKLAEQFRNMWQKEKEARDVVEAETSHQYKRYLDQKRLAEQFHHEYKEHQKSLARQSQRRQLIDSIKWKEERSAYLIDRIEDTKASILLDKALEEEARSLLAADRRYRLGEADEYRKRAELSDAQRKVEDAGKRRNAMLRDASQRLAISNTLSMWETYRLRQEIAAMDTARRAQHAAHAAMTSARSVRLQRAREARRRRARRVAAATECMRDLIRTGKW